MAKRRLLQVKPVRRYRSARYPSHTEPDPTLHPTPVPYPFGAKFVAAAASLGAAALFRPAAAEDPAQDAKPENPFKVEASGLPFRTSPYGTGEPSRLEEDVARKLIDKLFRDAGYRLQTDFAYNREGVAFSASGYDPEKKVGYVFGTYQNLDTDAVVSWREDKNAPGPVDPKKLSLAEAKKLEERAVRDKEFIALISGFDGRFEYDRTTTPDWSKRWDESEAIADPAKRAAAQRALEEERARAALERLEKGVREYIAWARSQGAM